ncbi:MAG: DUF4190 domain-containing protein [Actinomycetota bacterium]
MAFCAHCGTQLSEDARACPKCGHPRASAATTRTEGTAVAALVLGILGITTCPLILSIPAVIVGSQARAKIRSDPVLDGESLARAGVILGWVGIGLAAVGIVFAILAFVLSVPFAVDTPILREAIGR